MDAVVVVFCGPHEEGRSVPMLRISRAIAVALARELPILIAGDGNRGQDVRFFARRARNAGVRSGCGLYNGEASTLNDARMVAERLQGAQLSRIHLVTDNWHMRRARAMLASELCAHGLDLCEIICEDVQDGPKPPAWVPEAERRGLEDFQSGRYDPSLRGINPGWGKPGAQAHHEM